MLVMRAKKNIWKQIIANVTKWPVLTKCDQNQWPVGNMFYLVGIKLPDQ